MSARRRWEQGQHRQSEAQHEAPADWSRAPHHNPISRAPAAYAMIPLRYNYLSVA